VLRAVTNRRTTHSPAPARSPHRRGPRPLPGAPGLRQPHELVAGRPPPALGQRWVHEHQQRSGLLPAPQHAEERPTTTTTRMSRPSARNGPRLQQPVPPAWRPPTRPGRSSQSLVDNGQTP
jgi:hypothetical protein